MSSEHWFVGLLVKITIWKLELISAFEICNLHIQYAKIWMPQLKYCLVAYFVYPYFIPHTFTHTSSLPHKSHCFAASKIFHFFMSLQQKSVSSTKIHQLNTNPLLPHKSVSSTQIRGSVTFTLKTEIPKKAKIPNNYRPIFSKWRVEVTCRIDGFVWKWRIFRAEVRGNPFVRTLIFGKISFWSIYYPWALCFKIHSITTVVGD